MTENKSLDYEIENVGGIEHARLRLTPGVNVLRGHNAAGKTSAIRAIARTQGGKEPVERRDGAERGLVRGPGVQLSIRKVAKATGEASMELADTGPLARLIDPGLKTDAAARERIRALIELLDLRVDDENLELLAQKDEGLHEWLRKEVEGEAIDDLMLASERLRHRAHALARDREADAEHAIGIAGAAHTYCRSILDALGGPEKLSSESVPEAREKLDTMTRRHERALAQCEAREELEARQIKIRETLGERPDVKAQEQAVAQSDVIITDLDERIEKLRRELAALESSRKARVEHHASKAALLARTRKAAEQWDAQRAILDQPLEGPSRERVEQLRVEFVEGARAALKLAEQSADYRTQDQRKAEAEAERDRNARLAERYRDLGSAIPSVLGKILASAGAPGLTVIDGRLHASLPGKPPRDFEHRCSTGERVALALHVAATAYQGKVLPLDGALWASLDPENKAAFARLAEELELFVITEEPADGPLRIETE